MVQAWLSQHGTRFVGASNVTKLHRSDGLWHLLDAQGLLLGRFEAVVVANAKGCVELLASLPSGDATGLALRDKLEALQTMHGTLSQGRYAQDIAGLPPTPVNGDGCFIPRIDDIAGAQWFAGSTFETDATVAADGPAQHAANMERLRHLVPLPGVDLIEALNRAPVSLWSSTRCVTHDRMPLVGPVHVTAGPGLWLCAGMGSRGLSFSALCAELLVARMGAEPLPLEFSLSRSLDCNRMRRRFIAPAKP
jgi:tRNA 5-methylaminomethyl-2-thiouridine biosynthesis bifunctional protein